MIHKLQVSFFLAVRSIVRGNSWLSIMPTVMMILVFLNLVFAPALLQGVIDAANTKLVDTLTGNITVESKDAGGLISNAQSLVDDINKIHGVDAATPARTVSAQIALGSEHGTAEVSGIQPASFGQVYSIPKYMIEGSFLQPGDKDQIVLGAQIAGAGKTKLELYSDSLKNAHVGDKVTVSYANGVKKEYTVKGIYQTEFIQADLKSLISDAEFDSVQPGSKDSASSINVKTRPGANDQDIINQISQLRSDLQFRTWQERAGFVRSYTASLEVVNRILRVVALIVGGLTIFIITYVDVVNKRRQIGIERAIGISSGTIVFSYVLRGLFYTVLGSLLGILVFIFMVVPIEKRYPFNFPLGDAYLAVDYGFLIGNAVILLVVSTASALVPSWRAVRIRIVDAIWGN